MPKVIIDAERCKSCLLCVEFCPRGALAPSDEVNSKGYHPVRCTNQDECTGCAICALMCPDVCIEVYR
jgi:2-oxoglutarate ferredoxin oxidoreductase subunit delta